MKHVPLRTCVTCGAKKPQGEFLRVVSQGGDVPRWDEKGRSPGRGAYLCTRIECVEKAWARRALERTLKLKSAAPVDLKTELLAALGRTAESPTRNDE